ncbi:MAG: hypothetical protein LUQ16_06190, partial [Methanomassiliicoccales archaeon]|nr:hypothetical protein [Methanomassiliicoccales archaeon]
MATSDSRSAIVIEITSPLDNKGRTKLSVQKWFALMMGIDLLPPKPMMNIVEALCIYLFPRKTE